MVAVIGHQQRVVVFDVRELVRDHAGEFLAAERLHQARGHGDRRILRIAAGGERVGLRLVHHEHARHRQAGAAGQLGHEMDEVGRAVAVDLMGAVHRQHHAVRIPVGEQVGRSRDHERDQGAAGAADQIADAHEEAGKTGQQNGSLQIAHCRLPAAHGGSAAAGIPEVGIAPAALQDAGVRRGAALAGGSHLRAGLPNRNLPAPSAAPGLAGCRADRLLVQRRWRRLHCPATGSARGCSAPRKSATQSRLLVRKTGEELNKCFRM